MRFRSLGALLPFAISLGPPLRCTSEVRYLLRTISITAAIAPSRKCNGRSPFLPSASLNPFYVQRSFRNRHPSLFDTTGQAQDVVAEDRPPTFRSIISDSLRPSPFHPFFYPELVRRSGLNSSSSTTTANIPHRHISINYIPEA